jgi:hypothetical protein
MHNCVAQDMEEGGDTKSDEWKEKRKEEVKER